MSKLYKISAPGSLMLFGEHAVLSNKQAIVTAINKRIYVTLHPRSDRLIKIKSKLGAFTTSLDKIIAIKPFVFILAAIKQNLSKLPSGFELEIKSEFSSKLGLGSSAAVTVATLAVLEYWQTGEIYNLTRLAKSARAVIKEVQGLGSGADAMASVFGGVAAYKMLPFSCKKIARGLPLTVLFSGKKLATKEVLKITAAFAKRFPAAYSYIIQGIDQCAIEAKTAIKRKNWQRLGELMNIHQGFQDALGVNNEALANLIFKLRNDSKIFGAKISGSGLGDCVIGLGVAKITGRVKQIFVCTENNGVTICKK
ncbi:MAG: hypothetical protein M1561_07550 [Gammaproteobacteria bacterium]|nr:hypothetical protein [Gammaproteobacteria bacterium]